MGTAMERRILVLKVLNVPDYEICERLNVSEKAVAKVKLYKPDVEQTRRLQHAQHAAMLQTFMPMAVEGDKDAAGIVLKIHARSSALLGTDSPREISLLQHQQLGYEGLPADALPLKELTRRVLEDYRAREEARTVDIPVEDSVEAANGVESLEIRTDQARTNDE